MDGVLLVDKPRGPTSHDVVNRLRRVVGQRSIGHAGTLDPMATGLLVLGLGEGTKLLAALTDDDKAYEATIRLGVLTDTLDAEGAVTAEVAVPEGLDLPAVREAAAAFLGVHGQRAPAYSAIKRDGVPLHERARRGEDVEAPVREVVLRSVDVRTVRGDEVTVAIECGKGFYVRSFARDLAERLGTVGHLTALRRTRSGGLRIEDAVGFEALLADGGRELARRSMRTLVEACEGLPRVRLSPAGLEDARHGRRVRVEETDAKDLAEGTRVALLSDEPRLVALAIAGTSAFTIARGFHDSSNLSGATSVCSE